MHLRAGIQNELLINKEYCMFWTPDTPPLRRSSGVDTLVRPQYDRLKPVEMVPILEEIKIKTMNWRTHIAVGTNAIWLMPYYGKLDNSILILLPVAALASLLPDIDATSAKIHYA